MSIEVRPATAEEVRELRLRVLRPGAPLVPSAYDIEPATLHVGAFDGTVTVGCATVFPEAYEEEPAAWRLRGMAVAPDYQGRGIGQRVLDATTDRAVAAGAGLLWATGRVSALTFYERLGWEVVGELFYYGPANLPHRMVVRRLT
jgi:GNAT superfamily N-acetyltransferase